MNARRQILAAPTRFASTSPADLAVHAARDTPATAPLAPTSTNASWALTHAMRTPTVKTFQASMPVHAKTDLQAPDFPAPTTTNVHLAPTTAVIMPSAPTLQARFPARVMPAIRATA